MKNKLVVFKGQQIRRILYKNAWYFSVIDVVGALSDSNNPKRYWSDLKRKLSQESGTNQPYEEIVRLKLRAPDSKQRDTDCADAESLFRIIQSIPSPKAEPFKR
ncbi:MAG: Bro-N domain-containing protein [Candidatus Marinimicrobia bacterium]|nr:Bro-N domain-containing protein [Candidatus Neomarinimicrobiota bacterium]